MEQQQQLEQIDLNGWKILTEKEAKIEIQKNAWALSSRRWYLRHTSPKGDFPNVYKSKDETAFHFSGLILWAHTIQKQTFHFTLPSDEKLKEITYKNWGRAFIYSEEVFQNGFKFGMSSTVLSVEKQIEDTFKAFKELDQLEKEKLDQLEKKQEKLTLYRIQVRQTDLGKYMLCPKGVTKEQTCVLVLLSYHGLEIPNKYRDLDTERICVYDNWFRYPNGDIGYIPLETMENFDSGKCNRDTELFRIFKEASDWQKQQINSTQQQQQQQTNLQQQEQQQQQKNLAKNNNQQQQNPKKQKRKKIKIALFFLGLIVTAVVAACFIIYGKNKKLVIFKKKRYNKK